MAEVTNAGFDDLKSCDENAMPEEFLPEEDATRCTITPQELGTSSEAQFGNSSFKNEALGSDNFKTACNPLYNESVDPETSEISSVTTISPQVCKKFLQMIQTNQTQLLSVQDHFSSLIIVAGLEYSSKHSLKLLTKKGSNELLKYAFDFKNNRFLINRSKYKAGKFSRFEDYFFQELKKLLTISFKIDPALPKLVGFQFIPLSTYTLTIDGGIASLQNLLDFVIFNKVAYAGVREDITSQLKEQMGKVMNLGIHQRLNVEDIIIQKGLKFTLLNLDPAEEDLSSQKSFEEKLKIVFNSSLQEISKTDFERHLSKFAIDSFFKEVAEHQESTQVAEKFHLQIVRNTLNEIKINTAVNQCLVKDIDQIEQTLQEIDKLLNNQENIKSSQDLYETLNDLIDSVNQMEENYNEQILIKIHRGAPEYSFCEIMITQPFLYKHSSKAIEKYSDDLMQARTYYGDIDTKTCFLYLNLAAIFFAEENMSEFCTVYRDYEKTLNHLTTMKENGQLLAEANPIINNIHECLVI